MKNLLLALCLFSCNIPTAPKPNNDPPIEVSAKDLIKAYDDNEVSADQLYKNKRVQVSGFVSGISKNILDDSPYITIAPNKSFNAREVQCPLDEATSATLKKNQKIAIVGVVTGLLMNVQLEGCSIVP